MTYVFELRLRPRAPGVHGNACRDSETQTSIPTLVRLVKQGRLPLHRLISHYPFADIEQAVRDMKAGQGIKPVLTFTW